MASTTFATPNKGFVSDICLRPRAAGTSAGLAKPLKRILRLARVKRHRLFRKCGEVERFIRRLRGFVRRLVDKRPLA